MAAAAILYAGRDQALVQTRRLVLEQQGYAVEVCHNTEEFVGKFLEGDYDLVLLCNSLRDGERERLTSLVHRFSRRTPVLLVNSMPGRTGEGADPVCDGEPQTILETIARVLPAAAKPAAGTVAAEDGSIACRGARNAS